MGQIDFTSYFWLLVTGQMPNEDQSFFSPTRCCGAGRARPGAERGRRAHDARRRARGGAGRGRRGAARLRFGGARQRRDRRQVLRRLRRGPACQRRSDRGWWPSATSRKWREHTKAVPGFGHPQHAGGDPRANLLLAMADERGVSGEHVAMMRALQGRAARNHRPRPARSTSTAAIPSIMLDVGFPLAALKGIGLLCRTAA